jgi:hypothetical protein
MSYRIAGRRHYTSVQRLVYHSSAAFSLGCLVYPRIVSMDVDVLMLFAEWHEVRQNFDRWPGIPGTSGSSEHVLDVWGTPPIVEEVTLLLRLALFEPRLALEHPSRPTLSALGPTD